MPRIADLSRRGYRRTPQRALILGILREHTGHLTASDIADEAKRRMLPVDRSTVFRTVDTLAEAGLVRATRLGRSTYYELNRREPHDHHHLVCGTCGETFHVGGTEVNAALRTEAEGIGFVIEHADLVATGTCRACGKDWSPASHSLR